MPATIDVMTTTPKQVLMVIANPAVSTTLGWPVGFWGSELTHPYYAFREAGYEVTVASPEGGRCELDAYSDPRDESGYSAEDLLTMGFLSTPVLVALLEDTPRLADLDLERFHAIVVCGGQAPMFGFRENVDLQAAIRTFYEAEKPTAALCHGVSALIDVELSDGSSLIAGKTITGFANVEEDVADRVVGKQVMPWRIEHAVRERGANYVQGGPLEALRDPRRAPRHRAAAVSGGKVAELVIEALGR